MQVLLRSLVENHDAFEAVNDEMLEEVNDMMIVTPGDVITSDFGSFLRGHGTYVHQNQLIASVAGVVERVNQLISVRPLVSRYIGEVGDIIVGRITEVGSKRWKVDINGSQDASLMLSSVTLPGGTQRRRTYEDQLQMRSFFVENDLISAEIQEVRYDGSIHLHTRNLRYGKLENGQFLQVSPSLIKRMKQHMITLSEIHIDVILGTNGYIWITRHMGPLKSDEQDNPMETKAEMWMKQRDIHSNTPLSEQDRQNVALVYRSILHLNETFQLITPERILETFYHLKS